MEDDLDDLFGDSAPLQVPTTPSPSLVARLNEQSSNGCCQKVAWSKTGAIAYVTADGHQVILQHLLCDPETGEWQLSKPTFIDDVASSNQQATIVHLSWDHPSDYLAVVDSFGRTSIYTCLYALNCVTTRRKGTFDPEDDLGSIVGLAWVQTDRQLNYYQPVSKSKGQGAFKCYRQEATGPKSPSGKPALIVVTRNCKVRILYQDRESRWHVARGETEQVSDPSDLLSHTALCVDTGQNAGSMLLVTHNMRHELRLHRLNIAWDRDILNVQHLKFLSFCSPIATDEEASLPAFDPSSQTAHLTLLDLIPAGPEATHRVSTPPLVLAAFSYCVSDFSGPDSVRTVLCQWEILLEKPSLHPVFGKLLPHKNIGPSSHEISVEPRLNRTTRTVVPRALLAVNHVNLSTILGFMYSDGYIEFRHSHSLDVISPEPDDQITGLAQVGFAFPSNRPCLHAAMSPNFCAKISLDESHFPAIVLMQYLDPNGSNSVSNSTLADINDAFVTQLAIAFRASSSTSMTPTTADDVLATMQLFMGQFLNQQLNPDFTSSLESSSAFHNKTGNRVYSVLGVRLDYGLTDEPDQLRRNAFFQRCLSMQAALGFSGVRVLRPIPGTMALTLLELKHFAFTFSFMVSKKPPNNESELNKPEVIAFLLPFASWLVSLCGFIIDEVFSLRRSFEDAAMNPEHVDVNLINQSLRQAHSPALLLLFSSVFRSITKYCCTCVNIVAAEGRKHVGPAPLGTIYRELDNILQKAPVRIGLVEKILAQIDGSVKANHQILNTSDADRKAAESQILTHAEIPQRLLDPVKEFLFQTVPNLQEEVNEAELHLADMSRLGLTDDLYTRKQNSKHPVNAMTKALLRRDTDLRRCTRCCSLVDDVLPQRTQNNVLSLLARNCFCGSPWMVLTADESEQLGLMNGVSV